MRWRCSPGTSPVKQHSYHFANPQAIGHFLTLEAPTEPSPGTPAGEWLRDGAGSPNRYNQLRSCDGAPVLLRATFRGLASALDRCDLLWCR